MLANVSAFPRQARCVLANMWAEQAYERVYVCSLFIQFCSKTPNFVIEQIWLDNCSFNSNNLKLAIIIRSSIDMTSLM